MSARSRIAGLAASRRWLAAAVLAALPFFIPAHALAEKNFLNNGDFSHGSGDSVDGWRTDAWILTPGTTDYRWIRPESGQPGQIELLTHHDNDARWTQQVSLEPGWYYISAEARAKNVLRFFIGANVSVLENGIVSDSLKGDSDWRRIGLYLKVGPHGADVDVALRLGGYMNLTRGDVFFRDARVIRVPSPPPGATHVYDLDQVRKQETTGPIGHPWTLVATFLLFALGASLGWWMLGTEPAPREAVRAERRRDRRVQSKAAKRV
jgi:hypothetical protein